MISHDCLFARVMWHTLVIITAFHCMCVCDCWHRHQSCTVYRSSLNMTVVRLFRWFTSECLSGAFPPPLRRLAPESRAGYFPTESNVTIKHGHVRGSCLRRAADGNGVWRAKILTSACWTDSLSWNKSIKPSWLSADSVSISPSETGKRLLEFCFGNMHLKQI